MSKTYSPKAPSPNICAKLHPSTNSRAVEAAILPRKIFYISIMIQLYKVNIIKFITTMKFRNMA